MLRICKSTLTSGRTKSTLTSGRTKISVTSGRTKSSLTKRPDQEYCDEQPDQEYCVTRPENSVDINTGDIFKNEEEVVQTLQEFCRNTLSHMIKLSRKAPSVKDGKIVRGQREKIKVKR